MNRFARNILLIACCSGMGVAQLSYAITVKVWNTSNIVGNTVFYEMHYANDLQNSNLIALDTTIIPNTTDLLYPLVQSLLPPPAGNAANQGTGPFREIVVSAAAIEACKTLIKGLNNQTLFAHPITTRLKSKFVIYEYTPLTSINSGQRVKDTLINELDNFLKIVKENWLESGVSLKISPSGTNNIPQVQVTLDDNFSPLAQPFRNIYFALGKLGEAFGFSLVQPTPDQGWIQRNITSPFQKNKKVMFWTVLATLTAGGIIGGGLYFSGAGPYMYSAGSYAANILGSKFSAAAPAVVPRPAPVPVAPAPRASPGFFGSIRDAISQGYNAGK